MVRSIADFLSQHGLDTYASVFAEHDVDLETLSELTDEHLREMGLPLGASLRIRKAIAQYADTAQKSATAANQAIIEALAQVVTERRQVTVMFCDVVGSTKLAAELDPEEMRGLLLGYWKIIEATALRYDGYIAQHLGDGALIYFGYPAALENDAERAILAGLAILKAFSDPETSGNAKLQVRIGLATGTVVINQFTGGGGRAETLAIGQSVNFASRLQSLARPGNLVTDEQTRALADGLFAFEDIGSFTVDGFSDPTPLFKVTGARRVRSRFEARQHGVKTTFLGRKDELARALSCWRDCLGFKGHLLMVSGEPGIGKSRFMQELIAMVSHEAAAEAQLQCAAHSISSPLFPVIESLSLMANASPTNTQSENTDRLKALFSGSHESEALLLDLFDLHRTVPTGNVAHRRNLTLDALAEFFAARCNAGPFLFVVEDLHLCDPTTLELLDRLLQRCRDLPLMILATARPEFQHSFGDAERVVSLLLTRLGRTHTNELVREIFGTRKVTPQLLDVVAERTDGVPLFVEELLKSLAETGAIRQSSQAVGLDKAVDSGAIPRSLQSILMSRLDKLQGAKRLAQIAACIGREFSFDLLMRVSNSSVRELRAQLAQVTASELILAIGDVAFTNFSFRHALVRDAAYGSLLYSERQAIHAQIADALVASTGPVRAEVLAHHLTGAQQWVSAIQKWCEAGEAAKIRSADAEAVEYLKRALEVVEQLPHGSERDERELTVLLALIAPMRAARGFAAADVATLTARAILLADKTNDARRILPLLYNRWVYSFVTAHRSDCETLAKDILDRSAFDDTNLLRMTGLRALAATQFTAGKFKDAAQNFDASVAAYDSARQTDLTHAVGLDGKVTALGYCALTRWCLGDAATARAHARDALATAKAIDHISTTIFATYHETLLAGVLERDAGILRSNGRRLQRMGEDHGFAMWLICGKLLESLGICLAEPGSQAIFAAETCFDEFADMGVVYRPTYHAFFADLCLRMDDRVRGLGHLKNAKALIEVTGERWNEAEILRLEGELSLDPALAALCFGAAIKLAERQGAQVWASRAKDAAARLSATNGKVTP